MYIVGDKPPRYSIGSGAIVTDMVIKVECYAGHKGEETPRRFFIGERKVEVIEVLDRWLAQDHRYFKVRGDNGSIYILRYDVTRMHWELILFDEKSR